MKQKYTLSSVERLLGKHKYDKGQLPVDLKLFIDLAACFFGGSVAGPVGTAGAISFATLISTVSQKGVVLDAAKRAIELLRKDNPPYAERCKRIQEAYVILWIASFFDAFETSMPKRILKKIELNVTEKEDIAKIILPDKKLDPEINLPELVYGMDKVYTYLKETYTNMSHRLRAIISGLAFSESSDEQDPHRRDIIIFEQKMRELPDRALETFKNQYFTLYAQFGEFATFINLEKEREYKLQIESRFSSLVELINNSHCESEQDFQKLESILLSYSETSRKQKVKRIIEKTKEQYKNVIHKPIITKNQDHIVYPSSDSLIYPSIEESFVPHHYKLLEYTSNSIHLELNESWQNYDDQKDLFTYWGKFLSHVQSVSCPMLILGDPGSGKSLLTEIFSAMSNINTEFVVRVPLCKYWNMIDTMEIEDIICRQIEQDGDYKPIPSLQWLIGDNPEYPSTIIFDGYDEIQQATGASYSNLLMRLSSFQESSLERGRPVRIIITSRKTLIDKVDIPIGTLVMTLLPFDHQQQQLWIDIWNRTNHVQFEKAGLQDFILPNNRDLEELAGNPLLLLMLAIFDADFANHQNILKTTLEIMGKQFNRPHLYNKLISRFVQRELSKTVIYHQIELDKRSTLVNAGMKKLGIAALGMFVREKLSITTSELNNDFKKAGIATKEQMNEYALKDEEVFLGGFFFIHESRTDEFPSQPVIDRKHHNKTQASYVFLHKTFYEFLVADYILDCLFEYALVKAMSHKNKSNEYEQSLITKRQQLYIAINGAPLCHEPEIISMISQWWQKKADIILDMTLNKEAHISREELLSACCMELNNLIRDIYSGNINNIEKQSLMPDHSIFQLNAISILNLIVLIVSCDIDWQIDMRIWKFLAQYIKLFSPFSKLPPQTNSSDNPESRHMQIAYTDLSEDLLGKFMTRFQIIDNIYHITITKKDSTDNNNHSPLIDRTNVFCFLQDQISDKIYSIHNPSINSEMKLRIIQDLGKYDNSFILEKRTAQLLSIRSHKRYTVLSPQYIYNCLSNLSDALTENSLDASRFMYFLMNFNSLCANASYHQSSLCALITEKLLTCCCKYSSDWDIVYIMWLKVLQSFIDNETEQLIIRVLGQIDMELLSGNILYAIATFLENIPCDKNALILHKKHHIPLLLEHTAQTIATTFTEDKNNLRKKLCEPHILEYAFNKSTPKWAAGLLKLINYTGVINSPSSLFRVGSKYHIDSLITRYTQTPLDELSWRELPTLLQMLIMFKHPIHIKEILLNLDLNQKKILFSPEIYEYIAIANTLGEIDFVQRIFNETQATTTDQNPPNMKLSIYTAWILLSNNSNCLQEIQHLFHHLHFYEAFDLDPTTITRIITILFRKGTISSIFSHNDELKPAILYMLENIQLIYNQSSHVAIEFLLSLNRLKDWLKVHHDDSSFYVQTVNKLYLQTQINGHIEEASQLKTLIDEQ